MLRRLLRQSYTGMGNILWEAWLVVDGKGWRDLRGIRVKKHQELGWSGGPGKSGYGGEGGIRTREKLLTSTRFPVAPVRPLRHLSRTAIIFNAHYDCPPHCFHSLSKVTYNGSGAVGSWSRLAAGCYTGPSKFAKDGEIYGRVGLCKGCRGE